MVDNEPQIAVLAPPPAVYAATVKLPDFWQHDPGPWFLHIEAQFHLRGITVDETKYYHVVAALDSTTTRRLMGFLRDPPANGKYAAIKEQLLRLYQLSDEERADRLLSLNGLGDSKPTELMENMLALLGTSDTSFLFIQLFLRQLPTPVRTALAASPLARTKDYRGLAEEADRILLASRECRQYVAAAGPRPDRRKDGDAGALCYYHRRFGAKAKRCIQPCSFGEQGNARAGAHGQR